jgi:threonine/homoserine/homoserine lactone efflux protein
MTIVQSLVAFSVAAGVLTITPGLDTTLVLRTSVVEGSRSAGLAALGILLGCLAWGATVALGLGALIAASELAFTLLKWAGALYLLWLGLNLLIRPRSDFRIENGATGAAAPRSNWLRKGFLSNLLNPKIGVFYVSFLPQFVPANVSPGAFIFLLAVLHALMGIAWFSALILVTRPITKVLKRPNVVRRLDRLTGLVFMAFGARLAVARQ